MVGIETQAESDAVPGGLDGTDVLALPAGLTVIRLLPPLVITREQIDRVVEALHEVLCA